jgi:hypothetical protein
MCVTIDDVERLLDAPGCAHTPGGFRQHQSRGQRQKFTSFHGFI